MNDTISEARKLILSNHIFKTRNVGHSLARDWATSIVKTEPLDGARTARSIPGRLRPPARHAPQAACCPACSCAARAPSSSSSHTAASILFLGVDVAAPGLSAADAAAPQGACSGRIGASGRSSRIASAGRRGGAWGQRRGLLEDDGTTGKIRCERPSMNRLL